MPKFIDEEHKLFYEGKLKQIGKYDVYDKSMIYILSICSETRQHFKEIFDVENSEIKVECLNSAWQTSTSLKVCRLAFNLFNGFKYDSDEDIETHTVSKYYNVDEIFCCVYAPYFYEAIRLRYPEYTKYNNTIANVIELVRSDYSEVIGLNLFENILTLEYMYFVNDERDCYQIIEVTEFEDKLKIEFLTQHITKIIDIEELEDIFEMLHRQSTHKPLTQEEIKVIKDKYVKGTKIKLLKMYDPFTSIPSQELGIVDFVDDIGQIHIIWNNGSSLALVPNVDEFEILEAEL